MRKRTARLSRRLPARRRGMALISVLAIIVLITAVVAGFLIRAGLEATASSSYRSTSTTRLLADTAVNIVQASINEATTAGAGHAWATQPGAIRVFNDAGSLEKIYRLYSAPTLVSDTSTGTVLQDDVPPAGWASSPALWVDLNAPVTVSGMTDTAGNLIPDYAVFPVVDPRDPLAPGSVDKPSVTTRMPGFAITSAPGATDAQPVPMPVRWLYVLQNGQIVAPSGSGRVVNVPGASNANPIIGRIAFWTDDETAKVNINTAAGSFSDWNGKILPGTWDTPRFRIWEERMLFSENQPVKGEYQRYPGHPATTDLSGIFSALSLPLPDFPYDVSTSSISPQPPPDMNASSIFSLLPRYTDSNSSLAGSRNTTKLSTPPVINDGSPKRERLYSSVGELRYQPRLSGDERGPNGFNRQQIESGKFFLTARGRAPESTLFGTPRISAWPIDSAYGADPTPSNSTKLVSAFDKVISFCSTIGNPSKGSFHPYYFQRHDSTSPTKDYDEIERNQQLYAYLQNLTSRPIPGFGGTFRDKYSFSNERDQILTEMVDYIRCTNVYDYSVVDPAIGNPYPRFTPRGGNSGWGQVVPLKIGSTRGLGRMYTISEIGLLIICTADGNGKPPSEEGSYEDWRSWSNLTAPGTLTDLYGDPQAVTYSNPTLATTFGGAAVPLTPGQKRLQAMLLFEMATPMQGYTPTMPDVRINIQNLNQLSIAGQNPFPAGTIYNETPFARTNQVQQVGGYNPFQYFISRMDWGNNNNRVNAWSNPGAPAANAYRFVSNPITVATDPNGDGTITIGGTFTVDLQVKDKGTSARNSVQTFEVSFPSTTIKIPDLIQMGLEQWNSSTSKWEIKSKASDWWGFDKRIAWVKNGPSSNDALAMGCVIRTDPTSVTPGTPVPGWTETSAGKAPVIFYKGANGNKPAASSLPPSDVVRSLIAKDGDIRLVMATETVDADGSTHMERTDGYDDTAYKLAHNFVHYGAANLIPGVDLSGKLVPNATYCEKWAPKVPGSATPLPDWDWDSGLASAIDGAYANKPDEGNIYINGGASPYYWSEQIGNTDYFPSYFTANRIIPSAVMFGSLPTGVKEGVPWRTLLFRPQAERPRDPAGPKDHLFLDLFTMPVVEPYAISEPFSTAGKINMNYQIVPFTYIHRSTSLRAVLSSELVARVPRAASQEIPGKPDHAYYKVTSGTRPGPNEPKPSGAPALARLPLNLNESDGTLRQFKERFDNWDIFRSASEICDIYLTPEGYSWTSDSAADSAWYGDDFAMVGDNVRERPYANIYPRLTTKSNTFTVHFRVQALKNPVTADQAQWNEDRGVVTGEYRGSTTLERYLDPNNSSIPDYATNPSAPSLDTFYQWRIIANTAFSP